MHSRPIVARGGIARTPDHSVYPVRHRALSAFGPSRHRPNYRPPIVVTSPIAATLNTFHGMIGPLVSGGEGGAEGNRAFFNIDNGNLYVYEVHRDGSLTEIGNYSDGLGGDNSHAPIIGNSRDVPLSGRVSTPTNNSYQPGRLGDSSITDSAVATNEGSERYIFTNALWDISMGRIGEGDQLPYVIQNNSNSPYQGARLAMIDNGAPATLVVSAKSGEGDPFLPTYANCPVGPLVGSDWKTRFTVSYPEGTFDQYSATTDDVHFKHLSWDGTHGTSLSAAGTTIADMIPEHAGSTVHPIFTPASFGTIVLHSDSANPHKSAIGRVEWSGTTPSFDGKWVPWKAWKAFPLDEFHKYSWGNWVDSGMRYLGHGKMSDSDDRWRQVRIYEDRGVTRFDTVIVHIDAALNNAVELIHKDALIIEATSLGAVTTLFPWGTNDLVIFVTLTGEFHYVRNAYG